MLQRTRGGLCLRSGSSGEGWCCSCLDTLGGPGVGRDGAVAGAPWGGAARRGGRGRGGGRGGVLPRWLWRCAFGVPVGAWPGVQPTPSAADPLSPPPSARRPQLWRRVSYRRSWRDGGDSQGVDTQGRRPAQAWQQVSAVRSCLQCGYRSAWWTADIHLRVCYVCLDCKLKHLKLTQLCMLCSVGVQCQAVQCDPSVSDMRRRGAE